MTMDQLKSRLRHHERQWQRCMDLLHEWLDRDGESAKTDHWTQRAANHAAIIAELRVQIAAGQAKP